EALDVSPRSLMEAGEGLSKADQKARGGHQFGAAHQEVVVVGGDSLERPEQLGVVLLAVVQGHQPARPDALDVPEVEVLVRREGEEILPSLGAGEIRARIEQRGGGSVLQSSSTFVGQVEEEEVAIHRKAAKHLGRGFANLL